MQAKHYSTKSLHSSCLWYATATAEPPKARTQSWYDTHKDILRDAVDCVSYASAFILVLLYLTVGSFNDCNAATSAVRFSHDLRHFKAQQ